MTSEHVAMDLDAVFAELGQFGRYQRRVYFYVLLVTISNAVYNTHFVFAAGPARYRCKVPQCESDPPTFRPGSWGDWALPADSSCFRMVATGSECSKDSFSSSHTEPCNSWIYENHNTIVSEYDLACHEWKRTLVGTIRNVGVFTTLPITAFISDSYGRRVALIATAVAPSIVGLCKVFCDNYLVYLVVEYLDATLGAGSYSAGYVLGLEMVGIDKRVLGGNIMSITFAVGQMVAALVSWIFPYWKTYTIAVYAPSVLFIFYCCRLEESVRWLITRGRKKQAAEILLKIAAINKRDLSPEAAKMISDNAEERQPLTSDPETEIPENRRPRVCMEVLKSKTILGRVGVCSFWWTSVTFIYYGLSINSVMLPGSRHLNFILMALIEIPGYFISMLTLNRFGRKSSIIPGFFLCGISLFVSPFITNDLLMTTANMVGKLCISMVFCFIYLYTLELFPTSARQSLMNTCSMVGRIGSMSAPQTPLLMQYTKSLPYLIFGTLAVCSGLLMLLTPETLRISLPDTVRQAEEIHTAPRDRNVK